MNTKARNYLESCLDMGWTTIRKDTDLDLFLVATKSQAEYKLNSSSLEILKDVKIKKGNTKITTIIKNE